MIIYFYGANFVTSFITAMQSKESNFNLTNSRLRLVSGTTNPKLAEEIASYLGIKNVPLISKRFADGELYVQIQQSIRGCDVFLIQPTCAPVNDSLMELMIMVCLLYTSPSPRDKRQSRMPSSA